jgi:hypothetical protein
MRKLGPDHEHQMAYESGRDPLPCCGCVFYHPGLPEDVSPDCRCKCHATYRLVRSLP